MESFFVKAFGGAPVVKIMDFLLESRGFDFTREDVVEESGVSRGTVDKMWPSLEGLGVVVETRRIGNGVLYEVNKKSSVVRKLAELDRELTKAGTEKLFSRKAVSA